MSFKALAVLSCSLLFVSGRAIWADTLHGFCLSPTPTCADNNNITPTSTNPPVFGFDSSGTSMGDFQLYVLAPNNESVLPLNIKGSNVSATSVIGSLVSTTAFTSGTLENYLSLVYMPSNPLSAFLPSTQTVDPGATGYYVYKFDFGQETGNPKNDATAPTFKILSGSLPLGSVLLALELNGSTVIGATPPSGAILEKVAATPTAPEPASLALVGASLLAAILARKKKWAL